MTTERDIYERIVKFDERGSSDAAAQEMLTLGLLHFYKWDRVAEWERSNSGSSITLEKIQEFYNQHTEREIENRREFARNTLKGYAARYLSRQNFWIGVGQSLIAWFLGLVITYFVVKGYNLDIWSIFGIKT